MDMFVYNMHKTNKKNIFWDTVYFLYSEWATEEGEHDVLAEDAILVRQQRVNRKVGSR